MKKNINIAPSILAADFARLGQEVQQVEKAGANLIHLDIMDNHYVPNLTFGPLICSALINYGISTPLDVHLMCKPVDDLIKNFIKEKPKYITFHPESSHHVDRTIELIKSAGVNVGIALNPATPLTVLDHIIEKLDLILIMTVNPGFGGQKFIEAMYKKINQTRNLIDKVNPNIRLQVDGGVTCKNIKAISDAGADTFVMGSAIFNTSNYDQTFKDIYKALA